MLISQVLIFSRCVSAFILPEWLNWGHPIEILIDYGSAGLELRAFLLSSVVLRVGFVGLHAVGTVDSSLLELIFKFRITIKNFTIFKYEFIPSLIPPRGSSSALLL